MSGGNIVSMATDDALLRDQYASPASKKPGKKKKAKGKKAAAPRKAAAQTRLGQAIIDRHAGGNC